MVTACWPGGGGCGSWFGGELQPVSEISQQGSPLATECDHSTCFEYHGKRGLLGQAASGANGGVPHDGGPVLVRSDLANVTQSLRMPMKLPGQSAMFSPRFRHDVVAQGLMPPWQIILATGLMGRPILGCSVHRRGLHCRYSGCLSTRTWLLMIVDRRPERSSVIRGDRVGQPHQGAQGPKRRGSAAVTASARGMRRWQPSRVAWSPPRRSDELLYGRGGITDFTSRDNRGLTRARRLIARSVTGSIPQKPARGLK